MPASLLVASSECRFITRHCQSRSAESRKWAILGNIVPKLFCSPSRLYCWPRPNYPSAGPAQSGIQTKKSRKENKRERESLRTQLDPIYVWVARGCKKKRADDESAIGNGIATLQRDESQTGYQVGCQKSRFCSFCASLGDENVFGY